MTLPSRWFSYVVFFAALSTSAWSWSVHAQPEAAQHYLKTKHQAAHALMRKPSGNARDARLTQLLGELLDYDELSRRALSKHWSGRSASEREEFVGLLRKLVERSYQRNLQRTLKFSVRYEGAEPQASNVLVRTVARSKTNRRAPPVSIDYRMHQVNGAWRVFDIATDGVSLVRNYRRQFNRIISKDGWQGLLQRMQERLNSAPSV